MAASQQQYLAGEIALWLQQSCGGAWTFLGCHNLTGISVPRGETNPVYCRTGKNQFAIQRTWRGTPGLGGLTVVAYDTILNYLQEQPCAFNLVALHSASGSDDDPTNFQYLYYYNGVEITSEDMDPHVVGISPDDQTSIMISMPATFRQRVKVKALEAQTIDASAITTNDLNAVTFCDDASCDNFGNLESVGCQTGYAASDGTTAKIVKFTSGGSTLTSVSTPFSNADDNIVDIECDGDVVIAVNGETSEYAYSWDATATWTVVTTPTQLLNKVYMLGSTKIWFVAQGGYVYYSSNRGASIVTQSSGGATTQSLNDISAADSLTLYAVGDSNAFIKTTDGGQIWTAKTGPAAAIYPNDLYKVIAIPGTDIVMIGDEQGNIYRSEDGGDNWTTVFAASSATIGGIRGLVACDCNVILMAANNQDPYFYSGTGVDGVVYQSVNGGNSWINVDIPANDGLLDLTCCDVNRYWAVGVDGFVAQITGPSLT